MVGEMSSQGNVLVRKILVGQVSVGEVSVREVSALYSSSEKFK